VVLSFSPLAEAADFSFLAEEEPDAARAAPLAEVLAWLPVAEAEARAYFEEAELGAARAAPAVDAAAVGLELACSVAEVLAADAVVAELVVGAAAAEALALACSVAEVLAADAPAAEPVAGAAAAEALALACSVAEASAADALAAEPVVGAAAAGLAQACSVAGALAAEPAAELVVGAEAVDYDSAEYFVARRWAACWAAEPGWAVARRWVPQPSVLGAVLERGARELRRRWVCLALLAGPLLRRRACRD
jgi:hypothetical protein